MKLRIVCLAMLAVLLAGCAGEPAPETTVPTEAPIVPATILETEWIGEDWLVEETEPQPEPQTEGFLFLSVSRLDLSCVGDSEDIYLGTMPRDEVLFESMDPGVATFEDGVVTATGVGSTTLVARDGNKYLICEVSCLAEDRETLETLPEEVLRKAKRYPPKMGDEPMDYFRNTAMVGDSISQILFQWEAMYDYLGEALFLVRGGTSLNGIVLDYKPLHYKGAETRLEDALLDAGCSKVFIMLGQNDLRYREIEDCLESWVLLLEQIRSKNPEIEIHIQSVIPEWIPTGFSNENNEKIEVFNEKMKAFAAENDCRYVDIGYYVVDHTGRMADEYEMDQSIHMNFEGCYAWIQALKAYAFLQE